MAADDQSAESVADSDAPPTGGSDFTLPGPPSASPAGYVLLEEIGRGGMGVVYRARDIVLGREVAVKILTRNFAPGSAGAARFAEEARITGALQHPGIPAVHQTGTLPDGRPFLAMKLIRGRTLAELLRDRREHGRFVAIFEAVAQAVGYAHSRNIVHRDLKPHNVMVGAFGEVQVVDWGLAKSGVRSQESGVSETRLAATQSGALPVGSHSAFTAAGSVFGTPAFMPPEQASGATDQVDARSDVFGLGAILCVILTGRPPYESTTADATRELAARGELGPALARLDAAGADPALVALCKACLSPDQANRPESGGAVAAADDRARTAELDQRAAAVRAAEERKRRRALALAAGVVVAVLVAGTAVSVWQARRADTQAAKAIHEKDRSDNQYRQARLALLRMLEAFQTPGAGAIPQVVELQRAQSEHALAFFDGIGAGEADADPRQRADLAAACKEAARLQIALGRVAAAEQNLRRAVRLLEELNVEAGADPEPRGTLAACYDLLVVILTRDLPARGDEAAACGKKAIALSERLVRDFPNEAYRKHNLAQACDNLGTLYRSHPGGSVIELYERSLTLLRELHRDQPQDVRFAVGLAETCSNLGGVYWGNDLPDKAAAVFAEGLAILEPLVAAHPGHSWYASTLASLRINLGSLTLTLGRPADALKQFDAALAALGEILRREPNHAQARADLLPAHGGRAQTLGQLGRHADAVKDWDRVVELSPAANRPAYRLDRAGVLLQAGDTTKAAAEADEVAGAPAAEPVHLYEAGRLHARVARAIEKTPERAGDHAARAVAWLRRAHERGYFRSRDESKQLEGSDFAGLKTRADFQALLRDIAAAKR